MAPFTGTTVELPRSSRSIIQEGKPEITNLHSNSVTRNVDVFNFRQEVEKKVNTEKKILNTYSL